MDNEKIENIIAWILTIAGTIFICEIPLYIAINIIKDCLK